MGGMANAPAINPNLASNMMRNGMGGVGMGNMMGGMGMGMGMGNQGMMGMGNMGNMGNMGMSISYRPTHSHLLTRCTGYGNQIMSRVRHTPHPLVTC